MPEERTSDTILERWGITARQLTDLVDSNPSLRGMLLGYVAEMKLHEQLLCASSEIEDAGKADDHDRGTKGDRIITYRGEIVKVEAKSLQTNSICRKTDETTGETFWVGKAQVDASDRRTVTLPDGSTLETTCLLCGEFDLLAVNCFEFEQEWRFAYARNVDLPRSTYRKYTEYQREHLLATLVTVTWPPKPPFYSDPLPLLDGIVRDRHR